MKYRFGVIIDFKQFLRTYDPKSIFKNTDGGRLITELVNFLMEEDAEEKYGGRMEGSDYENLLNHLIEQGILQYHVIFRRGEAYVDLCSLLSNMVDGMFDLFMEHDLFTYCRNEDMPIEGIHVSGDSYAIVSGKL